MEKLNNKKLVLGVFGILLALAILSLGAAIYFYYAKTSAKKEEIVVTESSDNEEALESKEVYVDIKGAVKKPAVYKLDSNSIINDVVKLAGGFNKNAYQKNINLSKKIKNEMVIYIYTTSEYKNLKREKKEESIIENKASDVCVSETYIIDDCKEKGASIIESSNESNDQVSESNDGLSDKPDTQVDDNKSNNNTSIDNKTEDLVDSKININTASAEELSKLNGVGEKKALAILEYRKNNGLFESIEDIKKVSGIGDATYEKFKSQITV